MPLDHPAVKKVLELSGFADLNPVQRKAVDGGLFEGNLVVSAPTASGKTLIAEIAILDIVRQNKKAVYIVPLKALATEKYEEFREKYEGLGLKVAISIGDMDSTDSWLANYDIIIATSEKLDSLLRHGTPWIGSVGLVVVDEIHLLDSANRGPTLEIVLTRLRQVANPRILGLSATISNYKEMADWLGAKAVKSDYRPVKLYKGIFFGGKISFSPKRDMGFSCESVEDLIQHTVDIKKQALMFLSTRRNAEAAADTFGNVVYRRLTLDERRLLGETSQKAENALEHKTAQCEKLAACIRKGSAFHHAGLASQQKKIVEDAFKRGQIKLLTATPTLAAGINIPAYRVIIRDLKRFAQFKGMDYIPNMEIEQMSGRAGRPKYETEGEAILVPKTEGEARYAWENYINGQPEKIYSKLGVEPVLRTHALALIASEVCKTRHDLLDFFSKTFYAHHFRDMEQIKAKLEKVLGMLQKFGFISMDRQTGNGEFIRASASVENVDIAATKIGKRVSQLYIDPITANQILQSLKMPQPHLSHFQILHMVSRCLEARPLISAKKKDMEYLQDILKTEGSSLADKAPHEWDIEYEDYMNSIKTACFFIGWAEEYGEDRIFESFGVTPGELRARLDIADWLLYSMTELALLAGYMEALKDIKKVRVRMEYGIKEELLPLVKLKGIGRARARLLYNSNVTGLAELKKIPLESLVRIVGQKTAEQLKSQVVNEA